MKKVNLTYDDLLKAKNVSNPNLLINGDFKVNQRDFTEKDVPDVDSAYGSVYTVDRWRFGTSSTRFGKLVVNDNGGLDFTCYSLAPSVSQTLEDKDSNALLGKTVTASIKVSAITGNSPLMFWIRDNSAWSNQGCISIREAGTYSVTATIPEDLAGNVTVYISYDSFVDETTASIDWVKLEIGEVATPFSPRVYAEELSLCQRYYIQYSIGLTGFSGYTDNAGTAAYVNIIMPTNLRTKPTITVNFYGYLRMDQSLITPTEITVYELQNNYLSLECSASVTSKSTVCLMQTDFSLDAEIY